MPGKFFDTNVLVCLASTDPAKARRARELLAEGGIVSVQVLNEIANVTRRNLQFSWQETRELLFLVRSVLAVTAATVRIHEVGLRLAQRYGLSTYDGMIVAAALGADCDTLWSEDMHEGLVIDGQLRVVNPFESEC